MPSREQMGAFARFVSTAHSWYKHLPTLPPGVPMNFYLDPGAGTQRIVNIFGRVREAEKMEPGFHYSSLPTTDYRNRFGHAAFAAAVGTSISLLSIGGSRQVPSDDLAVIFDPDRAELVGLPSEVLEVGTAYVSGVIHPRSASHGFWPSLPAGYDDPTLFEWPAESGGTVVYAQIVTRLKALRAGAAVEKPSRDDDRYRQGPERHLLGGDLVLHRLLIPERERQQYGIVAALDRVVDLLR